MTWWEAALLGLVQGLTEFLPVSSSGHLVLAEHLLGLDAEQAADVTFEVFVHFGTVLSILTVYWGQVFAILREVLGAARSPSTTRARYRESKEFRLAVFVLITLIPTGLVYVLFKEQLEQAFANPRLVCGMLLVTGTLLLLTLLRRNPDGRLSPIKAFVVGIAQSVAMVPGISRSGSTICTAIYQNVDKQEAADFSFLMLLPVVLGATVLKLGELFEAAAGVDWVPLLVGTIVAYGSGIAAIKLVIEFVRRGSLQYFAFYCYAVGVIGLMYI